MAARSRPKRVRRRQYLASGHLIVAKAAPYLVERVADLRVPDDALTPVERTVRGWRAEILEDLGGDTVSAAKRAILDAAVGSKIILSSLDAFLFQLASSGRGLVNRRGRYAYRIVHDRLRVADSLVKQLATLGLDRVERPPLDLGTYLSATPRGCSTRSRSSGGPSSVARPTRSRSGRASSSPPTRAGLRPSAGSGPGSRSSTSWASTGTPRGIPRTSRCSGPCGPRWRQPAAGS
jgi:hypothetical protein